MGFIQDAIIVSTLRRYFVSESDMGLVPSHAVFDYSRPDEIFVIPGVKAPLILRPLRKEMVRREGMVQTLRLHWELLCSRIHGWRRCSFV
jgi:hypothetical protein